MFRTDLSQTQLGDIAFYQGNQSKPIDALIMARTGSMVVHVAIADGSGGTIAATSSGITQQPLGAVAKLWRPSLPYDPARLAVANAWLHSQLGMTYGYADIVNQVLLLADKDPILLDKSSDCSDLACKFLWIAGIALPAVFIDTNRVTPGQLAAALVNVA